MRGIIDPALRPPPKYQVGDIVFCYGEKHEVAEVYDKHDYYSYLLLCFNKKGRKNNRLRSGVPESHISEKIKNLLTFFSGSLPDTKDQ